MPSARLAILLAVDWLSAHLVLVAGLAAAAIVLVAVAVLVIVAVRTWRSTRAVLSAAGGEVSALTERADAAQARAGTLSERLAELGEAREGLDREVAVAKVLATHLGRALDILRAPLRALGR